MDQIKSHSAGAQRLAMHCRIVQPPSNVFRRRVAPKTMTL
jgi:hypothetical protein